MYDVRRKWFARACTPAQAWDSNRGVPWQAPATTPCVNGSSEAVRLRAGRSPHGRPFHRSFVQPAGTKRGRRWQKEGLETSGPPTASGGCRAETNRNVSTHRPAQVSGDPRNAGSPRDPQELSYRIRRTAQRSTSRARINAGTSLPPPDPHRTHTTSARSRLQVQRHAVQPRPVPGSPGEGRKCCHAAKPALGFR